VRRALRIGVAFLGLCLTVVFWKGAERFVHAAATSAFIGEFTLDWIHWRAFGALTVSMALYGLGIHLWRRLDDWLRSSRPD